MTLDETASNHSTKPTVSHQPTRRIVRWIAFWVGVICVACVAGVILTNAIQRATETLVAHSLQSVLAANANSIDMLVTDFEREAFRYARDATVRDRCLQMLARTTEPSVAEQNEDIAFLRHRVQPLVGIVPWVVLNRDGGIIASSEPKLVGSRLRYSIQNQNELDGGQSTFVLPQVTSPDETQSSESVTLMWTLSPLIQRNQTQGAFGWVMSAEDRFTRLLQITQSGQTDESFAIDGQGRLLSSSRFEAEMSEKGFPATSILNWVANDPSTGTLTFMADQATRGSDGMNLDGYRSYRGVDVVGAWKWLDQHGLAIATEMEVDEAYRPARILRRVLLATLAGIATLGLLTAGLILMSRRRPVKKQTAAASDPGERQVGAYRLLELLGVGGMGSVYRGRHEYLRRDVAIKVLEGERLSSRSLARFRREVQLTSTLRHPNTIAIFDYGRCSAQTGKPSDDDSTDETGFDPEGTFYYVMEYIDGVSLQQLIDFYGPQTPSRTVHLLLQICGSIAEAHEAGLIHRDIKPANILVSAQGALWDHIKVLDFGLVKDLGGDSGVTLHEGMTRADAMTGTPLYMAPETIRDPAGASPCGDLYSIGAVGYALLTGRPTYDGDSAIDLCLKQLEQIPPRPAERLGQTLPDALQDILMRCLERFPEDRFGCVSELAAALQAIPEAGRWTQAMSVQWWDNEFEQASKDPTLANKNPTKGATLAG